MLRYSLLVGIFLLTTIIHSQYFYSGSQYSSPSIGYPQQYTDPQYYYNHHHILNRNRGYPDFQQQNYLEKPYTNRKYLTDSNGIIGNNNIATGSFNAIVGYQNKCHGNANGVIRGRRNRIQGNGNLVIG